MFTFQCAFIKTFWKLNKQTNKKAGKDQWSLLPGLRNRDVQMKWKRDFRFVFWGC